MKILIASNGSQGADDALDNLPRAGLPPLAEALIYVKVCIHDSC
jgi:hypothetical protein